MSSLVFLACYPVKRCPRRELIGLLLELLFEEAELFLNRPLDTDLLVPHIKVFLPAYSEGSVGDPPSSKKLRRLSFLKQATHHLSKASTAFKRHMSSTYNLSSHSSTISFLTKVFSKPSASQNKAMTSNNPAKTLGFSCSLEQYTSLQRS